VAKGVGSVASVPGVQSAGTDAVTRLLTGRDEEASGVDDCVIIFSFKILPTASPHTIYDCFIDDNRRIDRHIPGKMIRYKRIPRQYLSQHLLIIPNPGYSPISTQQHPG
jgi:hypothetical protein